jgi:hypothetical protein
VDSLYNRLSEQEAKNNSERKNKSRIIKNIENAG